MKYKILIDNGKPYEETTNTEKDLIKILTDLNKIKNDYSYFDVLVFNDKNEDITESQFINEIIGGILENE